MADNQIEQRAPAIHPSGLRVGSAIPVSAVRPVPLAQVADSLGLSTLLVSDHVVVPNRIASRYPFTEDGKTEWPEGQPWLDAVVSMTAMAVSTRRIRLGTGVLVLPLRHPFVLGKQIATLACLAPGRVVLGVGSGWLREEFEALDVDFESRGRITDEWIGIMRRTWSGSIGPLDGAHYRYAGVAQTHPIPPIMPVILGGGMSRIALTRAAALDGWQPLIPIDRLDLDELAAAIQFMVSRRQGRALPEVLLRVPGDHRGLAGLGERLFDIGVTEIIVQLNLDNQEQATRQLDVLMEAL
jgi:probable F420-dependent oxidoreductase